LRDEGKLQIVAYATIKAPRSTTIHRDPPRMRRRLSTACLTWSSPGLQYLLGKNTRQETGSLGNLKGRIFHGSIDRPSHDPGWRPGALPGSGTPTPAPISAEAPTLADLARHSKRRLPPGPRWTAQPYRCPRRPPCVAVAGTQASQSITSASQFVASGEIAARIRAMGDGKLTVLGAIASLYLNSS
jgi:hypothetical protein